MRITVIVCTVDRCQILRKALESVGASSLPPSVEWEVLVVDNNSQDRTREVAEEFCRRYPGRFRYVFEPQQGLSRARNTGVREARGEILAFTDDDVAVEPTWLRNLTAALEDRQWAGAGGRIMPERAVFLPRWLPFDRPFNMGGSLCGYFNLGDESRELDEAPYGANMAFRKEAFDKYGSFRTDLGFGPGSAVPNEDTEFGRRLMAAGERLRYEPSAVVYHPVAEDRLRKDYFLAWYFNFGRAAIREIGRRSDIWGIPRPYLTLLKAVMLTAPAKALRWIFAWNPQERFYRKARTWQAAGEITEISRRWFSKKSPFEIEREPLKHGPQRGTEPPSCQSR